MADITRVDTRTGSLLSSTNRVEAPFVRVSIGSGNNMYTFGVYEGKSTVQKEGNGYVTTTEKKYPNYVQDLRVKKFNGTVNQYTLRIIYPIKDGDDPNFFEKIFSSVSDTRRIVFSYGDSMMPNYVFRNEEAIITKVTSSYNVESSTIEYVIEAVSTTSLSLSGTYRFPGQKQTKPSTVIKSILRQNDKYHLLDVFKGMRNESLVESKNLIASDDAPVDIPTCTNMSVLEYISTLVSYMNTNGSNKNPVIKNNIYTLTTYDDTSSEFYNTIDDEYGGGAYFKVEKVQRESSALNSLCVYNIDIGYKSANIVSNFKLKDDQNWSIYYNYNKEISNSDYIKRVNSKGEIEYVYSPQLTGTKYIVTGADSTWWTKVTQYPAEATMTIKGLLRPSVLMSYVKVNLWYWGHKSLISGYYLIKSQEDIIGVSGYSTTLTMIRISGDEQIV